MTNKAKSTNDETKENVDFDTIEEGFEETEFEEFKLELQEPIKLEVQEPYKLRLMEPIELKAFEPVTLEVLEPIESSVYESPYFIDDFEEPSQLPNQPNATNQQVPAWMKQQIGNDDYMYQHTISHNIAVEFGNKFIYTNENGNRAIATEVLEEFRKITPNLVWSRSGFYWRKRLSSDDPNKRQVE